MIDAIAEARTPMISMAASARIVEPVEGKKRWVFKTPQNDIMMALAIAEHMARRASRGGLHRLRRRLRRGLVPRVQSRRWTLKGIKIVANERYARADTSVTGQVLKMVGAKPDAVLIAGSGTPAALPQRR
jgi:branched-chain amino acid transport system substrate-binding protein